MAANFSEIKSYAEDLKAKYADRDEAYDAYEAMYNMVDTDLDAVGQNAKKTISPDARNAVQGAARIISANDVEWRVPADTNDAQAKQISSKLEQLAKAMWRGAGRLRRRPLLNDLSIGSLLYAQLDLGLYSAADLLKSARTPAQRTRASYTSTVTPVIFEPILPRVCYPDIDAQGMRAHYTYRKMTAGQVASRWGKLADAATAGMKSTFEGDYGEYWDTEFHSCWFNGAEIVTEEHKLPFIPIVSTIAEGSSMFEGTDYLSRQGLLFGADRSQLWKRQNLMLTAIYTNIFAIAANGQLVYSRNDSNKSLVVDFSVPGGVTYIDQGESLQPLSKVAFDNNMSKALEVASSLMEQSTMYKQVLGQSMGGQAAYSMVALMAQAGRQSLVPYQMAIQWACADAMSMAFQLLKYQGTEIALSKADKNGGDLNLKANEIPERVDIDAILKLDLPQDQRVNAMTASQLRGFLSDRWIMENLFGIGQPELITSELIQEQATRQVAPLLLQSMLPQVMQQLGVQQPGAPGQVPAGQPVPQQMPLPQQGQPQPGQQIPPELLAQLQQQGQGAGPGVPMGGPQLPAEQGGPGGLPPEILGQGGM